MNFDPKMIKNMSPEELSAKLNSVARAVGIDPAMLSKAVGDPAELQRKLSGMSEADIRRMAANADPDTLEKINKALGE